MIKAKSESYDSAILEAKHNPDLFPCDCLEILERVYGQRLKSMKPETIKGIIKDMMATATDADCSEEIEEAVTDWL